MSAMRTNRGIGRRGFIGRTGALFAVAAATPVAGFPAVVKRRSPNSLLSHACIGTANMGRADLDGLKACKDLHITALCDVDSDYLAAAKKLCPDARVYRDAFEMLAAEGDRIDSVNVSTPDHTHAQYVLDALGRGLNVYGQSRSATTSTTYAALSDLPPRGTPSRSLVRRLWPGNVTARLSRR